MVIWFKTADIILRVCSKIGYTRFYVELCCKFNNRIFLVFVESHQKVCYNIIAYFIVISRKEKQYEGK